jgi:non-specific serine/threonine protein kinase
VAPVNGATESLLLESAADLFQAGDLWAVNVALQSRAEIALASGEIQRGCELYQDSLELATSQSDSRGRAQALVGLGFCALLAGDAVRATQSLRKSIPLSLQLGNPELLAQALRGLAGVEVVGGDAETAARMLGAAQAMADAAGTVDWPVRRTLYAQVERQIRERLGEGGFDAAWRAGRKLRPREAAEVALKAAEAIAA